MNTKIISAFPGCGKTYFSENTKLKVLDSDSSRFSWVHFTSSKTKIRNPNFPTNYINHIKQNIGCVDIILVSSHSVVRNALIENNIDFTLIYPDQNIKEEYLDRFKKRGSDEQFINMLDNNWYSFLLDMKSQKNCKHIILYSGMYLSDYIKEN